MTSSFPFLNGSRAPSSSLALSPLSVCSWRLQREQVSYTSPQRSERHALQVSTIANATRGRGTKSDDILMVDPVVAKRLAAEQMQKIQAEEKLKRRRQIEAINGTWAMIGLTAGLVAEGQNGNGIIAQVVGYLSAIISFFAR